MLNTSQCLWYASGICDCTAFLSSSLSVSVSVVAHKEAANLVWYPVVLISTVSPFNVCVFRSKWGLNF